MIWFGSWELGLLAIRRKLCVAALLLTTSLTTPAQAAPVVGFIKGFAAAVSGSAFLGGTAAVTIGFAQGAAFAGTTFGAILGQTLISIGISAAIQALSPRPSAPEPSARIVNFAQPVSYIEHVVGRTRKGGPIGFTGFKNSRDVVTGATGAKRHYSVILASHPIEGVVTHYLDEREAELDPNGTIMIGPMRNYGRVRVQDGSNNVADPELMNSFPEITPAHDFKGLAVAHIWAKRPPQSLFSEVYPSGRQWGYTPVIDGATGVYDPRSGVTGFTRNLALNAAYVITKVWGGSVDWGEVAREADACDAMVINSDGIAQPKWRLDGVFTDDADFETQRAAIALAGDVFFYERPDGKWGFKVGRYEEPTVTLTEDDFFASSVSEAGSGPDRPTEVAPQYIEPDNQWREAPAGATVFDTTTRQVRDEPTLFHVASHNQASRCGYRIGLVKRAKYRLQGTVGLIGYHLVGQRFFRAQTLGVDQIFEIDRLYREEGAMSFTVEAHSVEPSDFEYDAATQEPKKPVFAKVESEDTVEPVTGFTGEALSGRRILFSWDEQELSLTQTIRFRKVGADEWAYKDQNNTEVGVERGETRMEKAPTTFTLTGLEDGAVYEAQIRNRTAAFRPSDWSTLITVQVVENSTPPMALAEFSASVSDQDVLVSITSPNDPNYAATRIYRADYPAGYSGPYDSITINPLTGQVESGEIVLVHTEYGAANSFDTWTDISPPTGHYAYSFVPINASGIAGPASGPATIDIL